MATDTYPNFKVLSRHEHPGQDFQIRFQDHGSPVTIMAPHGGRIEPGTSEIAQDIAGEHFNWYSFEGIKPANNFRLHITSHRFDEPNALALAAESTTVVTIHACKGEVPFIIPGGRDTLLARTLSDNLKTAGIPIQPNRGKFPGLHPQNICNRCRSGKGVQLELSRGIRDNRDLSMLLAQAIRAHLNKLV